MFAAAGTAGQRCTTMRRVIAHSSVVDAVVERVAAAYDRLPVGNPMADGTLVGPLVNDRAYAAFSAAMADAEAAGGKVVTGGERELADGHRTPTTCGRP